MESARENLPTAKFGVSLFRKHTHTKFTTNLTTNKIKLSKKNISRGTFWTGVQSFHYVDWHQLYRNDVSIDCYLVAIHPISRSIPSKEDQARHQQSKGYLMRPISSPLVWVQQATSGQGRLKCAGTAPTVTPARASRCCRRRRRPAGCL